MNRNQNQNNNAKMNGASLAGLAILGGVVGAAIGYGTGLLSSPKKRQEYQEKLEDFKNNVTELNVNELSQKLFNKSTKEIRKDVRTMLGNFQAKLSEVRATFQNLDEDKYGAFVDNFVDSLVQERDFNPDQVDTLRRYLMSDFKLMKRSIKA